MARMIWSGAKDAGSSKYDPEEMELVLAIVRPRRGEDAAIRISELRARTGLGARTIRSILSNQDGGDLVVAYTGAKNAKVFCAEFLEEEERYTEKLERQITTMERRVERRKVFGLTLPRKQGSLFDFD